jgi:O-antigen/teichoic acid export membrane protein
VGSLIAWGGITDFGLSLGLVNLVATASGRGNREMMRRYVSTAFAAYALLSAALLVAVTLMTRWSGLPALLGVRDPELAQAAHALVLVCGLVFAATTLTRITSAVFAALQEGYYSVWAHLVGRLASLALLLPLVLIGGSVVSYALVMSVPALLSQIALGSFLFGRRQPDLRPGLRHCDVASLRGLWGVGGFLTLHQLADMAILYSANILIANRLGPEAVPHYSVPYALFFVMTSAGWLIVSPYLPAYGDAAARGDWEWIRRRALKALAATAVLLGLGGIVLTLAGSDAVRLLTSGHVKPAVGLLASLAGLCLFRAISDTNNVLLIGLGLVKAVAFGQLAVAAVYVVGAWFLLPTLGLVAVSLAGTAAHLLGACLLIPYALQRLRVSEAQKSGAALADVATTGILAGPAPRV